MKSGGHTTNPGFSSTEGIQIYTGKFSQVTYDAVSGTATIGTGLIWDNVYQQLQEHNVSVLGGRVTGVSGCNTPVGVALTLLRTDWCWWLPTRWRFVSEGFPPFCTLTHHRQGTPIRPINTVLPSTPSSASTWFYPTVQLLV